MKISEIQVLINLHGGDNVNLTLDSISPYPVMGYEARAKIDVAQGFGIEWAKATFPGHRLHVVDCKTGKRSVIEPQG